MIKKTAPKKRAPYKEGGVKKTRQAKFVVTQDEYKALEELSKDWQLSVGNTLRTIIGLSGFMPTILEVAKGEMTKYQYDRMWKAHGIEPSYIEWRMVTLTRFLKYWNENSFYVEKKP